MNVIQIVIEVSLDKKINHTITKVYQNESRVRYTSTNVSSQHAALPSKYTKS